MARTPVCDKSSGQRKGTWTPEEDRKLVAYVTRYGTWNWRQLPKFAGLARCGKSCRLRWLNYLRPNLKRGNFTEEEDKTIVGLHATLGNRWSAIAAQLPGRTDNEIKNHWHTRLKNSARLPKSKQTPRIHIKTTQEKHEVNGQGSATVFESSPISPQSSSSTIQDSNRSAATFTNQGSSLFEDDDFSLFDLDPLDHAASDSNSFCLEQLSVDDIPFVDFSGSEAQVSPQGSSSDQNLFRAVEKDAETSKHSESEQVLVNNAPAGNLLELQEAVFQDDIWTEDLALALAAGNFFTRPSDLPGADLHLDFCDPQPSAFLGQPMFSPYHSLFA